MKALIWNILDFHSVVSNLGSKDPSSWLLHGDSWLTPGPWFSFSLWRYYGRGEGISFLILVCSNTGKCGVILEGQEGFHSLTPVQIYLERLFPGGSEINGNLNFSPWLPKIQINFVFNCNHFLKAVWKLFRPLSGNWNIVKFGLALDRLSCVLVKSLMGHRTGHSGPVRKPRWTGSTLLLYTSFYSPTQFLEATKQVL